ncbi:oligopeptide transporter 4 [Thamnocephalis sphaerospora]|uniref:Oligopeptide transporter 4 n=1 Tax=Thamnocephalis sphaerospora TaxID=78915 RepID=A0A4P9XUJ7_9FUNG|nr:oligopeptide transporter 4 [Thamnocephalis sphaerospora]|eukprot:RKP09886.1 oligopeptide transporter 4 [Thamnocephalis sphaerospora]
MDSPISAMREKPLDGADDVDNLFRASEKEESRRPTVDPEDSPYAIVRATVSNKDDTSLPTITVRFWLLAVPFTIAVSLFNQIFWFRTLSVTITGVIVQLITLPLGKILERVLPPKSVGIGRFRFSLNPGPFNAKEHALILVATSSATSIAYAVDIIVIKKVFYMQDTPLLGSILLTLTTQCIGYGLAGVCYKYLVRPAAMIWPSQLVSIALLRTFHEEDADRRGSVSRMRFFLTVTLISAIYYFIPGFLAPFLSTISILCLAMPGNVTAARIGSFTKGMGVLSFTLDWNGITSSLASPLMTPFWAIANIFVGFIIFVWVVIPSGFFGTNTWDAQNFAIFGSALYKGDGSKYPTLTMLNPDLSLNESKYAEVGAPRMTYMFAISYGIGFAGLSAVLMHIVLYYGREIIQRFRESRDVVNDVHCRLMDHYPTVPQWWYLLTLTLSTGLSILVCEVYGTDLPWWGLLLAVLMAAFFLLPIGIITAISNQTPGLNIITEFVIGYIMPGRPIANVTFKTYGYIGMAQAITFLGDLKLGHYLKIPPRDMFLAQLTGTILAGISNVLAAYMMFAIMPDVCTTEAWYCRNAHVFFNASVIWGVIGPNRMFGTEGYYSALMWFFLAGALLPIPFWLLARRYPNSWVKYINIPVLLAGTGIMPPAYPGSFPSWFFVGFIFQFFIYRYRQKWWARYNYILSAGLDAGVAISSFLIFFALSNNGIELNWWGSQPDCPVLENKL